jgi:hypothetical protein
MYEVYLALKQPALFSVSTNKIFYINALYSMENTRYESNTLKAKISLNYIQIF